MANNSRVQQLIDILYSQHLIDQQQQAAWSAQSMMTLADAEKIIRREVFVSDEQWTQFKGAALGVEYVNLVGKAVPTTMLNTLPKDISENYQIVVFDKDADALKLGMVDPTNIKAMEAAEFIARKNNLKVKYFIISSDSFRAAAKQYETLGEEVGEALDIAESIFAPKMGDVKDFDEGGAVDDVIKSAPVTKIISVILRHAIEGRASDIHVEPVGDQSRVRYRIDGILHTTIVLPIYVHAALVSRIKVMANLKIDETRAPQDGRIRLTIHKRDIDFRISTIPLIGNEKVVMRILATPDKAPTLEDLGYMGNQKIIAEANIQKPNGMFLVTGPTGSGKSTTLYAVLDSLNREAINITTLEDPVEYYVKGVNQSQIRPEVGYTFANGLRSLLRQDPDIIMVGEIRDNETAALGIQAALTGHFLLSTLHTNSALGAVPRLMDMKVEPFLLSSTLNVIIAQRLVRKICDNCREEEKVPEDIQKKITQKMKSVPEGGYYGGLKPNAPLKFFHGKGCVRCGDTGYSGRVAIVEAINVNKEMRDIISSGFDSARVDKALLNQNFISMEQDGIIKSLLGVTTIEEVLRASESDL